MNRWSGKVAVVTGASVGIGAAVVKALLGHGVKVIGCGRNLDKLKELESTLTPRAPACFRPVRCDVTSEEEIAALFDVARKEFGGVHILVNNSGLSHPAPLLSGETKDFRNMCEVNVIGLTVCAREAVKLMREKGVDDGHIINLGSMSGHRVYPNPGSHFYAATKYAVTALTIGMRNELQAMGSHIRVTQISPGLVETEFAFRATGPEAAKKTYSNFPCLQAGEIADIVVHALSAPAHCGIHDVLVLPVEQPYAGRPL